MTGIYRIRELQPSGRQTKMLSGTAQFTVGQQGTNTMTPYMDAYETFVGTDMEAQGIGLPNGLSAPTSQLNNLGTGHKRLTVFTLGMVPYVNTIGSMDRLLNSSTYDTLHNNMAIAVVAAGFGKDSVVRCGHEANGAPGNPGHYPWSVGFHDPFSGTFVTAAQYLAGAAKVEAIWRSHGYTGFFEWNIGTGDTSAAPPSALMPMHGDPKLTLLGWDWYARIGWGNFVGDPNGSKQQGVMHAFLADQAQDEMYMAFCRANGILQAHSEYGQDARTDSPYAPNDTALWYPAFYDHCALNGDVKAYGLHYQVNQFSGSVVQEHHLVALSVATTGGSPSGVPATSKWTGDYPPGVSVPNTAGPAATLAQMGSLQSSSNTGLHWVWNTDPNKTSAVSSWRASFGDVGAANGKGSPGLQSFAQPDVPTQTTTILPGSLNRRGQLLAR